MREEGVIKFDYHCVDEAYSIADSDFHIINPVRQRLHKMGLIGQYEDGISYGNISMRTGLSNSFIISASDTGKYKSLEKKHYVKVIKCCTKQNICIYKGVHPPSSESLTHHSLYTHVPHIGSVIHVHSAKLWNSLKGHQPSTADTVTYGSLEMVKEMAALLEDNVFKEHNIIVMGGHPEGIIAFGNSPNEAMIHLIKNL